MTLLKKTDSKLLASLSGIVLRNQITGIVAMDDRADIGDRRAAILRKVLANSVWVDRGSKWGECLEWTAGDSGKPGRGQAKGRGHSYPRMTLDGHTCAVHRVVWITLNGYLPAKKQLDHVCNNRRCVIHCEAVTHKQNQKRRDRERKLLSGPVQREADADAATRPYADVRGRFSDVD